MNRHLLRALTLFVALNAVVLAAGTAVTSVASASSTASASKPARAFAFGGTIVSVNISANRFVVLAGSSRQTVLLTSTTRVTLNGRSSRLRTLRVGDMVTVRGSFQSRYRVAASIAARTAASIPIATTPASANLKTALNDALYREQYAEATYRNIIAKLGSIAPFSNILPSEVQHVATIVSLMANHKVAIPATGVVGAAAPATRVEACRLGASTEVSIVSMYEYAVVLAKDYPDVVRAFNNLKDASEESHLPAFVRCS